MVGITRDRAFPELDNSGVRKIVSYVLKHEKRKKNRVQVNFVDEKTMQDLNRHYRRMNEKTDVLSFSYDEEQEGYCFAGELFLSPDVIREQSERFAHTFTQEMTLLLIHGTLHLLGYDHPENTEDLRVMRGKEDLYFKGLTGRKLKR